MDLAAGDLFGKIKNLIQVKLIDITQGKIEYNSEQKE
jgi:hypothetical protein